MKARTLKDAMLGFGGVAQGAAIANDLAGVWLAVYVAGLLLWIGERLVHEEKKA